MKLGELFYELSFKADDTKLKDFIKSIGDLDMSSVLAGTGLGALFDTTKKLLDSTKELGVGMRTFSNVTGMSAQQMTAWGQMAEQAGTDANVMKQALMGLQTSITQTKMGNPDMGLLSAYSILNQYAKSGLSINQDYFTQIEKIRDGVRKLSPEMARQVVMLMHQDETMLNIYKSTDAIWNKRKDMRNVMDPEDVSRMVEMNAEWKQLGQEIGNIGNKYATEISPAVINSTRALINLTRELKDSWIGNILSRSAEGWGKIGGWTAYGMDQMTTGLARFAVDNFKDRPDFNVMATPASVTSNIYVQGGDPEVVKQAVKEAHRDAVAESFYSLPARRR